MIVLRSSPVPAMRARGPWARWAAMVVCCLASAPAAAQNLNVAVHDPSRIVAHDGRYYVFYTGTGIRMRSSGNLLQWTNSQRVINPTPSWVATSVPNNANANFWAPDVAYFNGLYHLYYSVSTFGSQDSAIGLATNPTLDPAAPDYSWTDRGPVIESNPGSPYNAIDPSIIQTSAGEVWMAFGSFWNGIYLARLDPTTGMLAPRGGSTVRAAWNSSIEAAYVHERGGYFYLFANWGSCCQGSNSTYNIRVGRSTSITGPYLDRNGVNMTSGGGTLFLGTEGNLIGPGHLSIFNALGTDWLSYHYYDGNQNGRGELNIRALRWTADGWPVAGPAFPVPEPASVGIVALAATGIVPLLRHRRRTHGPCAH